MGYTGGNISGGPLIVPAAGGVTPNGGRKPPGGPGGPPGPGKWKGCCADAALGCRSGPTSFRGGCSAHIHTCVLCCCASDRPLLATLMLFMLLWSAPPTWQPSGTFLQEGARCTPLHHQRHPGSCSAQQVCSHTSGSSASAWAAWDRQLTWYLKCKGIAYAVAPFLNASGHRLWTQCSGICCSSADDTCAVSPEAAGNADGPDLQAVPALAVSVAHPQAVRASQGAPMQQRPWPDSCAGSYATVMYKRQSR